MTLASAMMPTPARPSVASPTNSSPCPTTTAGAAREHERPAERRVRAQRVAVEGEAELVRARAQRHERPRPRADDDPDDQRPVGRARDEQRDRDDERRAPGRSPAACAGGRSPSRGRRSTAAPAARRPGTTSSETSAGAMISGVPKTSAIDGHEHEPGDERDRRRAPSSNVIALRNASSWSASSCWMYLSPIPIWRRNSASRGRRARRPRRRTPSS